MQIKRFYAADIRQAMRKVKEALGEDAVILSNKHVDGGVEIIAAVDYAEDSIAKAADQAQGAAQPPSSTATVGSETAGAASPGVHSRASHAASQQEPALVEMRSELQTVRGLLEHQLATMAIRDYQVAHPYHFELRQRLGRMGLGRRLCQILLEQPSRQSTIDELWRRALAQLANAIPVADDDILNRGGVIALVGPTGVGKTTTVAKLAARFAMRFGARHVALISTDNFRIGAHEQIKAYARIIDVPFRFAHSAATLEAALDYFCERRLVIIDTSGMSQRDMRLTEHLAALTGNADRIRAYLVAAATSRLSGLEEVVSQFEHIDLQGCILSKLDESTCLGHALDVVIRHNLPVSYISDGQRVPEDLKPARAQDLVSRAVAMMQDNAALLDDEWAGVRAGEVAL